MQQTLPTCGASPGMKKWKIYGVIVVLATLLSIWYFGIVDLKRTTYPRRTSEKDELLRNADILAHPEYYPVKKQLFHRFITAPNTERKNTSNFQIQSDKWRKIKEGLFVFSAYEDHRSKELNVVVRIIALIRADEQSGLKVRCLYRNNSDENTKEVRDYSPHVALHEQHNGTYVSAFFYCFLHERHLPSQVALIEDNSTFNNNNTSWLNVHGTKPKNAKSFGLCVRPMFDSKIDMRLLAEFLGYYESVGVNGFTFYDYKMPKIVESFLEAVAAEGHITVKLVRWKLPQDVANDTWQYGQMVSIQDCVLRNIDKEFVLLVDMDEFLVPRQQFTLSDLMEDLTKRAKYKVGSYVFRQSFFCKVNDTKILENAFPLTISTWINRPSKIWPTKQRSKIILRTEAVSESGIHFVWKHWKGWKPANVPWQLAMIHHYNAEQCRQIKEPLEEDRTAETFKVDVIFSDPVKKIAHMFTPPTV